MAHKHSMLFLYTVDVVRNAQLLDIAINKAYKEPWLHSVTNADEHSILLKRQEKKSPNIQITWKLHMFSNIKHIPYKQLYVYIKYATFQSFMEMDTLQSHISSTLHPAIPCCKHWNLLLGSL